VTIERASYIAKFGRLNAILPPSALPGPMRLSIDTETVVRLGQELEDEAATGRTFAFLQELVSDAAAEAQQRGLTLLPSNAPLPLVRVTLERIGPGAPAETPATDEIVQRAVDAYVGWRVGLDIVGPMRALEQMLPPALLARRLDEERERDAQWRRDHATERVEAVPSPGDQDD